MSTSAGYSSRHSRGQGSSSGSLPRPAWGSGSHGGILRAASPEPPGPTPNGDRMHVGSVSADVVAHMEAEAYDLRNKLALRDQRISELTRHETHTARLKNDERQLAKLVHTTRRQLCERDLLVKELQAKLEAANTRSSCSQDGTTSPQANVLASNAPTPADVTDSSATLGALAAAQQQVAQLQTENHQLQARIAHLQATASLTAAGSATAPSTSDGTHPSRYLGGLATPGGAAIGGDGAPRTPIAGGQVSPTGSTNLPCAGAGATPAPTTCATPPGKNADEEERPVLYSTVRPEYSSTLGMFPLQGFGMVDGVSALAKVLLPRLSGSLLNQVNQQQQRQFMSAPVPGMAYQNVSAGMMLPGLLHAQPQHTIHHAAPQVVLCAQHTM